MEMGVRVDEGFQWGKKMLKTVKAAIKMALKFNLSKLNILCEFYKKTVI